MNSIETDRLLLRKFKENDIEDFFEYAKMPEVGPNCGWHAITDREKAEIRLNYIIYSDYYAIVLKESNKVIGSISIFDLDKRRYSNIEVEDGAKELGFALSKDYWGNGYMKEAINGVLEYLFDTLKIPVLYAITTKGNINSEKLQEKSGLSVVGEMPEVKWLDGEIVSMIQRRITIDEWQKKKKIKENSSKRL